MSNNVNSVSKCTCPCGCTADTTIAVPSEGLKRHARCDRCAQPVHVQTHQGTRVPPPPVSPNSRLTRVYVPTEDETRVANVARKAYEQELWDEAWTRWQDSIPIKFRNATTSLPALKRCISQIRSGITAVSGAVISGEVGRGKTWEAVGFANDVIREGLIHPSQVLFGTEGDLLASVANSAYGDVEVGYRRLTSGRYRMIIIDDVGRAAWLREDMRPKIFSRIFDNMWSNNNIVVVTTNLSRDTFEQYIGTAAMARLRSMVGLQSIFLKSSDKREEITKEILASITLED